jgi:hypothetical protein
MKVGRKWDKEIYKVSKIKLSDVIIFKPSVEENKLNIRQKYFLYNLSGKTKDKIQYLIRLDKARAEIIGGYSPKGIENYLYEIDIVGEIQIIRNGQNINFRELCKK